jgi:uncharacterized DUF497 family protein
VRQRESLAESREAQSVVRRRVTVFDDAYFFAYKDLKHSADEDCYVIIGFSKRNRLLTVAFTELKRTRIISARKSNHYETELYQEESGEAL